MRFYVGLGLTVELSARLDVAWVARDSSQLMQADTSPRAQGAGLMLRTALSNFYVEFSYGALKVLNPPPGSGKAAGGFNLLIGTQPFDLWKRH